MKCEHCNATLRHIEIAVQGTRQKAWSYQCPQCDYFEFETNSVQNVVQELQEHSHAKKL